MTDTKASKLTWALEEIAALRDENERLKNDAAIFYEAAAGLLATNDALRAQLAEAQDALQAAKDLNIVEAK
ncbi:MAG: hypothetical protein E6Q97_17830 [Desulfurellales bacterium]|nr:MAG: hypothetical protein E6Q97_17830 [Desulfurellales bacterium]